MFHDPEPELLERELGGLGVGVGIRATVIYRYWWDSSRLCLFSRIRSRERGMPASRYRCDHRIAIPAARGIMDKSRSWCASFLISSRHHQTGCTNAENPRRFYSFQALLYTARSGGDSRYPVTAHLRSCSVFLTAGGRAWRKTHPQSDQADR